MFRGAFVGGFLVSIASAIIGAIAWANDPIDYSWFIGPGELVAFLLIKGDNYHSYRDMSRHGIPVAGLIWTLIGAALGAMIELAYRFLRWLVSGRSAPRS